MRCDSSSHRTRARSVLEERWSVLRSAERRVSSAEEGRRGQEGMRWMRCWLSPSGS